MPWRETNPMLERHHFVHDYDSGHWTMTELCTRYGVSRNTPLCQDSCRMEWVSW
jgi:hypothetical protein